MDKTQRNLLILASLLLLLVLGAIYYFFIHPVREDITSTKEAIVQTHEDIRALTQEKEELAQVEPTVIETGLMEKIPLDLGEEMLIQLIHQAELMTDSKVTSISFDNGEESLTSESLGLNQEDDEEIVDNEEEEPTEEEVMDEEAEEVDSEEVDEEETSEADEKLPEEEEPVVSAAATIPLPDNIRLVTLQLAAEHRSVEEYVKFMEVLETHPRLIMFDSTTFDPFTEDKQFEEEQQLIQSSSTITLFYMPKED